MSRHRRPANWGAWRGCDALRQRFVAAVPLRHCRLLSAPAGFWLAIFAYAYAHRALLSDKASLRDCLRLISPALPHRWLALALFSARGDVKRQAAAALKRSLKRCTAYFYPVRSCLSPWFVASFDPTKAYIPIAIIAVVSSPNWLGTSESDERGATTVGRTTYLPFRG